MDHEQLNELKQIELSMLKLVIEICEQYAIKYYLLNGSMLGAVRHQGFIPWDDDIDIGMPRADYDRFLAQAPALLPEHCFLQNFHTDPEVLMNYSKLRNSNTTFIETSVKNRRINHGVYIDIFPLDFFPDDPEERKRLYRRIKAVSRRLYCAYTLPEEIRPRGAKAMLMQLASRASMLRYPRTLDALLAREKLYRSCKSGSYLANFGGAWKEKEIAPAAWYGEGQEARFEGLRVRIPSDWDQWLTQVYGDYMQPPPPEKQCTHHHYEVIDVYHPYTSYTNQR